MSHQNQNFEKFVGSQILKWVGQEMAVIQEGDPDKIAWANLSEGLLQFYDLEIHLSDGLVQHFDSHLDEECNYFGLYARPSLQPLEPYKAEGEDILRGRLINELPTGKICDVQKFIGLDGNVIAITLWLSSKKVTISCGEIVERNGKFTPVMPEEFILVTYSGAL